ncbi:MAG: glycosyltransferase family 2 protein [Actinomycetota bacterium]
MADFLATVVVVNYNGAHLLPACLDALAAQLSSSPTFHTVVVDNASTDGSLELLARDYPWVRVITSRRNLGFAGGNNLALAQVTTPFAVLLNNDAAPEPGWLANLLSAFGEASGHDLGIVTGKVLFMPRFVRLHVCSDSFRPAKLDTRDLGFRIYQVLVDGCDVTGKVIWADAAYGPEGTGEAMFRWTRPQGDALVPVPAALAENGSLVRPVVVSVRAAGPRERTAVQLSTAGVRLDVKVGSDVMDLTLEVSAGTEAVDVINNVGGIVLQDGSGADRGFLEVDEGQYEESIEVFTACGNGMAMRTTVGREAGWFDRGFFMYYEDTDLSWRCRSRGWAIRYVPTAVLRHVHAASSTEWSPRWRFHVERNRLLMLTKNATGDLARTAITSSFRSLGMLTLRSLKEGIRQRRRPAIRPLVLHSQILLSFAARTPAALRDRRAIRRSAVVPRDILQEWLVSSR